MTWQLAASILPTSTLMHGKGFLSSSDELTEYAKTHEVINVEDAARDLGITLWPKWQYWTLGAVGSLGLFVCVLLHELSHSVVARRSGIPVEGITLFFFGGVSQLKKEPEDPGVEWRVAVAGPLMSIVLGLVSGVLYFGLGNVLPEQATALLFYFMVINLMLAVFNLLPGFPLDGGRLLRAILWKRSGDFRSATVTATWLGRGVGMAFIVWGLLDFGSDLFFRGSISSLIARSGRS